ncbi:hypothetical protein EON62_01230 [archaeon]|nr:MAG: hypothetical protein EON62_01230 [archaeon]
MRAYSGGRWSSFTRAGWSIRHVLAGAVILGIALVAGVGVVLIALVAGVVVAILAAPFLFRLWRATRGGASTPGRAPANIVNAMFEGMQSPQGGARGGLSSAMLNVMAGAVSTMSRALASAAAGEAQLGRFLVYNIAHRVSRSRTLAARFGRGVTIGLPLQLVQATSTTAVYGQPGQTRTVITMSVPVYNEGRLMVGTLTVKALVRANPYTTGKVGAIEVLAAGDQSSNSSQRLAGSARGGEPPALVDTTAPNANIVAVAPVDAAARAAYRALRGVRTTERFERRAASGELRTDGATPSAVPSVDEVESEVGDTFEFMRDMLEDTRDERLNGVHPAVCFDVISAVFAPSRGRSSDLTADLGGIVYDDLTPAGGEQAAPHAYSNVPPAGIRSRYASQAANGRDSARGGVADSGGSGGGRVMEAEVIDKRERQEKKS